MPRQSSVSAAYAPVGGKKPSSSKCSKFCYSLIITIILCVVVMFPGNNKQSPPEEFQLGQAHHNYTSAATSSKTPINTKKPPSSIHIAATDEEDVELVLDDARKEIKKTEKEQLDKLEQSVDNTTTALTNKLRIGMGRMFGNTLSSEEVEAVATQVQSTLTTEAKTKLRGKADQLTNKAIKNIETMASSEEKNGYGVMEIEEDVYDDEMQAVDSIKTGIKLEASQVQQSLSARAAEIEKAILEERLSAKLGKRVKLVIEENEVAPMDGDDELFQGITALTKSSTGTKSSTTPTKGNTVLPIGSSSSSSRPTTTTTNGLTTSNKSTFSVSTGSNSTKTTTNTTTTTTVVKGAGTSVNATTKVADSGAKPKVVEDKKGGKKNGKVDKTKKNKKIP